MVRFHGAVPIKNKKGIDKRMKWKRVLSFSKRNIYQSGEGLNTIYSSVKDEVLTLKAIEKAKKYGCKIINFRIGGTFTSICEITVWADKANFLGFINDYISEFDGYIENIEF